MSRQVNLWITDEDYKILVKEAARRQLETGKIVKIATLASELVKPAIARLNGQTPSEDNIQESKQDDKQSKLANEFNFDGIGDI